MPALPKSPRESTVDPCPAGWEIDAGRREVRTPGEAVRPTARSSTFWYLAENKGLVLSRAQILEAAWGYDYLGETRNGGRTSANCARNSRAFRWRPRGVGYRFDA